MPRGSCPQKTDQIPIQFQELENLTVYSADTKTSTAPSFKKDAVYGDTKEVLIGKIHDVAVDSLGRVFIADVPRMALYAFEPDGRFITQLGSEGRGPGEFSVLNSLKVHVNRLYAYDPSQYRIHIFTLNDLTGEKTVHLAENRSRYPAIAKSMPWISEVYVRNDGTYIAKFLVEDKSPALKQWQNFDVRGLLYLLNNNGFISRELLEFTSEIRTRIPIQKALMDSSIKPFFGNAQVVISSNNSIYLAEPDHFLIKIYSPDGYYERAFYYPVKKIPLTQESAIDARVVNLYTSNMPSIDLPETWPVLNDIKIDDKDRLWVATTMDDMTLHEWWVLEPTGKLITKFEWPRSKLIEVVRDSYIYTKETDPETSQEKIVRYRIEFE